jgi:hypothetical protein
MSLTVNRGLLLQTIPPALDGTLIDHPTGIDIRQVV